jgi:phosphatidylserine decarboxylase
MLDSIMSIFVPVHREGYRFIAIFAAITLVLFWLLPDVFGWIGVLLTLWCAYFFRDPPRVTPLDPALVISPADGRISAIEQVSIPPELAMEGERLTRISVFMNVFDVHVNRSPVDATVLQKNYVPGKFINAELDKASEDNERMAFTLELADKRRIGVVQIAGLVARRIVAFAGQGERLQAGERFGLIRFGSRVDVYLPEGCAVRACVGQRAIAGETVLADLSGTRTRPTGRTA